MMEKITAKELEERLVYYVKRVMKGESFEVTDIDGNSIAEFVPTGDSSED